VTGQAPSLNPETPQDDTSLVVTPRPDGDFNVERHKAEQRAASALHKQLLEAAGAEHRRVQEAKRNDQHLLQERIMFFAVIATLAVVLVIALIAAIFSDNDETQEWGRSIVVLIVGGVVGGLAVVAVDGPAASRAKAGSLRSLFPVPHHPSSDLM
jgi:hypothetical protein